MFAVIICYSTRYKNIQCCLRNFSIKYLLFTTMINKQMADNIPRAAVCSNNLCDNSPDVEPDPLSSKHYWSKQVTRYSPCKSQQQSNNVVTPEVGVQDKPVDTQEHTSTPQTQNHNDVQTISKPRCHNAKRKRQDEQRMLKLSHVRASRACHNKKKIEKNETCTIRTTKKR